MVSKRRGRRRARSDDPNKLGRNGAIEGSDIDDHEEEESGNSGETAIPAKPKGMLLNRAGEPSSPSTEDAGGQGSGEASPVRSSPTPLGGKRGKKRSPPPLQEEERPEKRGAGPDAETVAASAPKRKRKKKKKSKRSAEKDRRSRRKKEEKRSRRNKEEKKQARRALTQLLELQVKDNSEDTPSSPEVFQEDEHHDSEMSEEEPSNTSVPLEDGRAREEEQQEKEVAEQGDAGGTSPPHEKDMHGAHREEDAANQKDGDDTSPSSPKDNHIVDEEVLPKDTNNAPSTKLRGSETEKKPAVDRSLWSYDDELKILSALVEHAQSHDGAMPDSSHLLASLTFDKIDANEEKLTDKIRKLKARYHKMLSRGCPSDRFASRLFKLSEKLWGQVDEDEQVEPTSKDFGALSKLYPHLAKEVKAYAEAHGSRDLIMAMVMTIGDEKARDLDAKCKKLQIEAFKLELSQASLINELLSALPSLTRVSF